MQLEATSPQFELLQSLSTSVTTIESRAWVVSEKSDRDTNHYRAYLAMAAVGLTLGNGGM